MSVLVFHFDGMRAPLWMAQHEADIDWWRLLAKRMGLTGLVMVDVTPDRRGRYYTSADESFTYQYFDSLDAAENAHPELQWFYFDQATVAQDGAPVSVAEDFDFLPSKDDAAYVFGSDLHGLDQAVPKVRHIVSFDTVPVEYAVNAAVLALGLRYLQVEGL